MSKVLRTFYYVSFHLLISLTYNLVIFHLTYKSENKQSHPIFISGSGLSYGYVLLKKFWWTSVWINKKIQDGGHKKMFPDLGSLSCSVSWKRPGSPWEDIDPCPPWLSCQGKAARELMERHGSMSLHWI